MPKSKPTDSRLWRGEQPAQHCTSTEHRRTYHWLVDGAEPWEVCQVTIKSGSRRGQVCGARMVDVVRPYNVHLGRATSKRAASEVTAEAKVGLNKGTFVNPAKGRILVNDELAVWLENHHRPGVAPNSFQTNEIVVRRHLYPKFQGVALAECNYSNIQAIFTHWVEKEGARTPTMLKARRFLDAMFTIAVRDSKLAKNPLVGVKVPIPLDQRRRRDKRVTAWNYRQVESFFEWLNDPYWTVFFTAARTGLRDSELCGLRIEDVTWGACGDSGCQHETAHLHVRQARVHVPGGEVVAGPPKSANSERAIPIGASLEREFRAWRAAHPAIGGLFFTDPEGEGLRPNDMSMRFARRMASYRRDHDVPRIGLHGLRHSYITNLIVGKVDILTVSRLAGHASMHYTADVYGHLMPDAARAAVDQIEAALGGQG